MPRDPIVVRIEQLIVALLEQNTVKIVKRCARNAAVNEEGVMTLVEEPVMEKVQLKRCSHLAKVLEQVYMLKVNETHASKRDIYYMDTELFGGQKTVNDALDDIARSFRVQRGVLNVNTTCKGLVVGNFKYKTSSGCIVDVSSSRRGVSIGVDEPVSFFCDTVRAVVVVEKDATLMRLIDDDAARRLRCIFITGKGYPCIATRRFVHLLHKHLGHTIPFHLLTDADPHGMHIAATYCLGSLNLTHENIHLAVPSLSWIGFSLSDFTEFSLPVSGSLPCTPHDISKAEFLLAHPSLSQTKPSWFPVIRSFIVKRVKAEIQALQCRGLSFISDTYLPQKLGLSFDS
eukprot:TRINITY_DN13816_c0_g1_i1.p1 TRINITY_DN13816_c0_g1~~TRINITY_DN13816_c0_g1_i1.p1  ORF type:complete len:344 (+),score=85.38 TRINITY_DN13816_c0_g1_i1:40-1071(+)